MIDTVEENSVLADKYDFLVTRYINEGEFYERLLSEVIRSKFFLAALETEITELAYKLKELREG